MEPITTTIAVVTAITACVSVRQYVKIQNKNEEIDSLIVALTQYSSSYAFEECDKPMIRDCSQYLQQYLKKGSLTDRLRDKSEAERDQIVKDLVNQLAKRMKVKVGEINIQPLAGGTLGAEIVDDSGNIKLYLNADMLSLDADRMVFVMLHELRHAVQDSALRNDIWGFSDERKAQWLVGNQQYVKADSKSKFTAYYHQIVEYDANAFAQAVLDGVK